MRHALVGLALVCLAACAREEGFAIVHADDVLALRASKSVTLVDANGADTRAREGVIPGAVLLTSYGKYDPATELPPDKSAPLVFYCANVH